MIYNEVNAYITTLRSQNVSEEKIKQTLLNAGWLEEDIEDSLRALITQPQVQKKEFISTLKINTIVLILGIITSVASASLQVWHSSIHPMGEDWTIIIAPFYAACNMGVLFVSFLASNFLYHSKNVALHFFGVVLFGLMALINVINIFLIITLFA